MATIGRHDAVTELANGWRFSGPIGWLAWLGLHLVYLMGFRNRIKVFVDWAWNYLTYDRGSRILREGDRPSRRRGPNRTWRSRFPPGRLVRCAARTDDPSAFVRRRSSRACCLPRSVPAT